jgi:hypothetical protein
MRIPLAAALLLLVSPSALAEGPVGPGPQEGSPEEEIARLALKISKALKENEEALSRIARGEQGEAKPVDIRLPPAGSESSPAPGPSGGTKGEAPSSGDPPPGGAPSGGKAPGGDPSGGEASGGDPREGLRGSAEQGRAIASALEELLRQAGRMGGGGGGGGSPRDSDDPSGGGKGEEPKKKPDDGDPEGGEKSEKPPEAPQGKKPPSSAKDPPKEEDPRGFFLAKLPDKVKEAVLNGDFDQVPEKYRDLVAEWTKALGEKDRKESEDATDRR